MFTFILNFSCDELDDPDVRITDKDFKAAIVTMLKAVKENMLILNKQIRNPSTETEKEKQTKKRQ